MRMLSPKRPQQPQLITLQAMDAWRAILGPADIDSRGIKMDLLPSDIDQLANPQCMPEGHEDQQPVADHSESVRSVWYRLTGRLCCCRVVGVHMAKSQLVQEILGITAGADESIFFKNCR
jgi:hypothetical protein